MRVGKKKQRAEGPHVADDATFAPADLIEQLRTGNAVVVGARRVGKSEFLKRVAENIPAAEVTLISAHHLRTGSVSVHYVLIDDFTRVLHAMGRAERGHLTQSDLLAILGRGKGAALFLSPYEAEWLLRVTKVPGIDSASADLISAAVLKFYSHSRRFLLTTSLTTAERRLASHGATPKRKDIGSCRWEHKFSGLSQSFFGDQYDTYVPELWTPLAGVSALGVVSEGVRGGLWDEAKSKFVDVCRAQRSNLSALAARLPVLLPAGALSALSSAEQVTGASTVTLALAGFMAWDAGRTLFEHHAKSGKARRAKALLSANPIELEALDDALGFPPRTCERALDVLRSLASSPDGAFVGKLDVDPAFVALRDAMTERIQALEDRVDTIEAKVSAIQARQEGLNPEPAVEPRPKLPPEIQAKFDSGAEAFYEGRYEDARKDYGEASALSKAASETAGDVKARVNLALIVWHWDRHPEKAKALLETCLSDVRGPDQERERASVLHQLGILSSALGDLDGAEALLRQALTLERKFRRRLSEAEVLLQLGWEAGRRGASKKALELTEQALDCFLALREGDGPHKPDDITRGLANSYYQLARFHRQLADADETEKALVNALRYQRKLKANPELAKMLFELAELRFHQKSLPEGMSLLQESAEISHSLDHFLDEARCFDLMGRAKYTSGQKREGTRLMANAASIAAKSNDPAEAAEFIYTLGQARLESGNLAEAEDLFQRAQALSASNPRDLARCLVALASVAKARDRSDDRSALLTEAIRVTAALLPTLQAPPERAAMLATIGSYHMELENYLEALGYFERANAGFQAIPDIHGVARTMGVIANLKGRMGRHEDERATYLDLKRLVDGTPFYDIIAIVYANLADYERQHGSLDEAKRLLQLSEALCRKHDLPFLADIVRSLDHIEAARRARYPPKMTIPDLIDELYGQLANCAPGQQDAYLRYWLFSRGQELAGNLMSSLGVHLLVIEDDLPTFMTLASDLACYSDWTLLAISGDYPGPRLDQIRLKHGLTVLPNTSDLSLEQPGETASEHASRLERLRSGGFYQGDIKLPEGVEHSHVSSGGTIPRYFLVPVTEDDGSHKTAGALIVGWALSLPPQFHGLVSESDATRLKKNKMFIFHNQRSRAKDKLLWDLRIAHEFHLIPVYRGALPHSDSVTSVRSTQIDLPILSTDQTGQDLVEGVRDCLLQLLTSNAGSAGADLGELSSAVAELRRTCRTPGKLRIKVYLLEPRSPRDPAPPNPVLALVVLDRPSR